MKIRRYGFMLLVLLAILLTMTACSKKKLAEPVGVMSTETLFEGNANLNVYAVQEDRYMIELFERFRYDIFKTQAAGITVTWFEDMASLVQTVTTEMMGGGGPDVLFFYPDTFDSSYHLIKNNMFADLNPIIEETEYKLEVLNPAVMDAGIFKEKRLFMPINYSVDMFIAVDDFLTSDVSFDGMETMEDFMDAHERYVSSKSREGNIFNFTNSFSLPEFLNLCNVKVVDFSTKKVVCDDKELRKYVDWYRELQQYFVKDATVFEGYNDQNYGPILEGDMVFLNNYQVTNHNSVKFGLSLYKELSGNEEADFYSLSDLNSGTSTAVIGLCGAVNKNSEHKAEAFELIKCALSKSMQENRQNYLTPVRSSVLEYQMLDLSSKSTYNFNYEGTSVQIVPLTAREEATFRRFVQEPGNVIVRDNKYNFILTEVFADYIAGFGNWEDSLNQAKHRLKIYLNE